MKVQLLIRGKGHRLDEVNLDPGTAKSVLRYLRACGSPRKGPLFTSERTRDKRLDPRSIRKAFRAYFDAAGVRPDRTLHSLRHTLATLLVESGMPVSEVAARLRHADLVVTLRNYYSNEPSYRRPAEKGDKALIDILIP